jgi:hypothetical protein
MSAPMKSAGHGSCPEHTGRDGQNRANLFKISGISSASSLQHNGSKADHCIVSAKKITEFIPSKTIEEKKDSFKCLTILKQASEDEMLPEFHAFSDGPIVSFISIPRDPHLHRFESLGQHGT